MAVVFLAAACGHGTRQNYGGAFDVVDDHFRTGRKRRRAAVHNGPVRPSITLPRAAARLQGFVEAGSVGDTVYSLPYYFGSRFAWYRQDVYESAGVSEPRNSHCLRPGAPRSQRSVPTVSHTGTTWPSSRCRRDGG